MNTIKKILRRWLLDSPSDPTTPSRGLIALQDERPSTALSRTFSVHEAMNGTYITFTRRKYNHNGPDDYRNEIYIVQPGETLVDAISTVLVLTEK
jgi:hypothetical protein